MEILRSGQRSDVRSDVRNDVRNVAWSTVAWSDDSQSRGGYRGGPSWGGTHPPTPDIPLLTSQKALETIAERHNDDDVEMGHSCVSGLSGSLEMQSFFREEQRQLQGQQQQDLQREQQQWQLQQAIKTELAVRRTNG